MIIRLRTTTSIVLSLFMNFLLLGQCAKQNKYSGLNCTITKSEEKLKGVRINTTEKIIAVNRCPADFDAENVIRKCENLIDSAAPFAPELFSPVTNLETNVTFWNKFCAKCNKDVSIGDPFVWLSWFRYQKMDDPCANYETEIRESDVTGLQEFTKIFARKGMKLVSTYIDRQHLECKMEGKWPILLLNRVIPCLVKNFREGQDARLRQCQYSDRNGRICTKMRIFIEGLNFKFDNDSTNIYEKWAEFRITRGEYFVKSGYENVLYLCQRPEIIYTEGHWCKISIIAVSIIFISGYLVMKFDKKYLQNFTNKVIYTYSVGLIMMYVSVTFIYLAFPVSCVVFYLAQFSWFYHLFWTKIMTAEFFHLIYYACKKREVDTNSQNKRYRVVSGIGFVLPMILILMYYLVLRTNDDHCPMIPGHIAVTCSPAKDSRGESFMNILNLIMKKNFLVFIPLLFLLAHVSSLIYFTKWGPAGIKSKSNRHHVITLMKMAYLMGFHWILHRICVWYGRDEVFSVVGLTVNMDTISQLSVDLHGVLMVLIFGLDGDMSRSQRNDDGGKMAVKFHKSSDDEERGNLTEGTNS